MKKVTIQDIAQKMQLSRNTVAKALNDGAVSYETKMSVLQTAQKMGYAKLTKEHLEQLRGVRTEKDGRAVLVLTGRSQEQFWNLILAGISDELNAKGYRMLLHIAEFSFHKAEQYSILSIHHIFFIHLSIDFEVVSIPRL